MTTTITLEATPQIIRLSARSARVWIGHTSGGVPVQAFVSGIAVEGSESMSEFAPLAEQAPLAFHGIPLKPGLDALAVRKGWRSLCLRCGLPPEHTTPEHIDQYVQELQTRMGAPPNFPSEAALARYGEQEREWQRIRDELVAAAAAGGEPGPSAYQVSLEQRKRMLERGQRPITFEELCPPPQPDTVSPEAKTEP